MYTLGERSRINGRKAQSSVSIRFVSGAQFELVPENVSVRREITWKLKMDEAASKWPRHRAATKSAKK